MRLLGDRVLVHPDVRTPPRTASGIEIAESYWYEPEVSGVVLAVGDGPQAEDGTRLPHYVSVGDRVMFSPESGHEIVVHGARRIVLREDDLLAIIA